MTRLSFFSENDLSIPYHIERCNILIDKLLTHSICINNINDVVELYHLKAFCQSKRALSLINRELDFQELVSRITIFVADYFSSQDRESMNEQYKNLDVGYIDSFWRIIVEYNCLEPLKNDGLFSLLSKNPTHLRYVLREKKVVDCFPGQLSVLILDPRNTVLSAEVLIEKHLQAPEHNSKPIFFPKQISNQEIESILSRYLKMDEPNLNYVRLISRAKASSGIKLSPETKLLAQNKELELEKKYFSDNSNCSVVHNSMTMSFYDGGEDEAAITYSRDGENSCYSINRTIIKISTPIEIIQNIGLRYHFLTPEGLISHIHKNGTDSVFERLFIHGKDWYPKTSSFFDDEYYAVGLISMLGLELEYNQKTSLEECLNTYYSEYLFDHYGFKGTRFHFASKQESFLIRVRTAVPEIEKVLKQFSCFVKHGEVDNNLVSIYSSISFKDVPSLVKKKYVYTSDEKEIRTILALLFSDQSDLLFVNRIEKQYRNFCFMAYKEQLNVCDYRGYQEQAISFLEKNGIVEIDENGNIKLVNVLVCMFLYDLYTYGAVSYWGYLPSVRDSIDKMTSLGWLTISSTLLTKEEASYFNYYLNDAEFSNGDKLRNKYAHGSENTNQSEKVFQLDYYKILMLLILLVLKIEIDLLTSKIIQENHVCI